MTENGKGGLSEAILENLPALAGPARTGALKAFSQLLGGAGSYIAAWLRRPTQAVDDKTDAKSLITKRIAEAAADVAASDPEVIAAAIEKWLPSELRRQENKKKIVLETVRELETGDYISGESSHEEIDEDWLNVFERFSENASSDRMQGLWARVLSGEIVRPGSFSRSTLRFLYELDKRTAECFEKICPFILGEQIFVTKGNDGLFVDLLHLETSGILTGATGLLGWSATADDKGVFALGGEKQGILVKTAPGEKITLDAIPLTQIGIEISRIVPNPDEEKRLRAMSEILRTKNVQGVALAWVVGKNGNMRTYKLNRQLWGEAVFDNT